MPHYSKERKQAVMDKLFPPNKMSVAKVSRHEDIGIQTLYSWRNKGQPVPGNKNTPDRNRYSGSGFDIYCHP